MRGRKKKQGESNSKTFITLKYGRYFPISGYSAAGVADFYKIEFNFLKNRSFLADTN